MSMQQNNSDPMLDDVLNRLMADNCLKFGMVNLSNMVEERACRFIGTLSLSVEVAVRHVADGTLKGYRRSTYKSIQRVQNHVSNEQARLHDLSATAAISLLVRDHIPVVKPLCRPSSFADQLGPTSQTSIHKSRAVEAMTLCVRPPPVLTHASHEAFSQTRLRQPLPPRRGLVVVSWTEDA